MSDIALLQKEFQEYSPEATLPAVGLENAESSLGRDGPKSGEGAERFGTGVESYSI